ncbi:MAG: DNA topoisomerase IB [Acidimicrobiia bacterium]
MARSRSNPVRRGALRYVSDTEPGIRRTGHKRFRYTDEATGEPVSDRQERERLAALAVPPAWTDVWVCADPDGHVQATGRDARGRKQYRYHPDYRAARDQAKFADLVAFGQSLGDVRHRVDEDLSRRGLPFERVVALVVALLEHTLVRVGNEEYAADNDTYGLTTLRHRHVRVEAGDIRLRFDGKGGRSHDVACDDPRLCRLVRCCQDLRGQLLFQYHDDDGGLSPVSSHDVNGYLRAATGLEATAKTFRTWGATVQAGRGLAALGRPGTERECQHGIRTVVADVARRLGNTPAVCRASYVHPVVVDLYGAGALTERWAAGPNRPAGGLEADERRLLHVLGATPARAHRAS